MKDSISKYKNITDYVYGVIAIPSYYFKFIDTLHLQRLRNIKQLPTAQYAFPSANHSCFEHSIGTYYLSKKYITDIKNRQKDLDINQTLINTISLCGLFYNLGTIPFMNSFQKFYEEKHNKKYDPKLKAYNLFLKLIESKGIDPDCLTNKYDNQNFYLDIIKRIFTQKNNNMKYYEKIIFNPKTGIDCDSFDSINRDLYKFGNKPLCDHNILMNNSYIINDDICYNDEIPIYVSDYYIAKYIIASKFYFHRISNSVELMYTDIFKYVDKVYNLDEMINSDDKILYYYDSFINNIKYTEKDNKNLKQAKKLLDDIDKRNLYSFVGEYYIKDSQNKEEFDKFNANILIENKNKNDIKLIPDEIRIKKDIINYCPNEQDPLDNISFYDKNFNVIKKKSEDVSKLLPYRFKSKVIRVFLTNNDKEKIEELQNALINYTKKYKGYTNIYKSSQKLEKVNEVSGFSLSNNKEKKVNKSEKGYNFYFRNKDNNAK